MNFYFKLSVSVLFGVNPHFCLLPSILINISAVFRILTLRGVFSPLISLKMLFYNISTFLFINEKYAVYSFWNPFGNFELCCWRRLLRVPWTARRSNQSILKEISPEYSLEGLMLDAETPILWPPDAKNRLLGKRPWCWERLRAGEEGDDRGWDGWMASLTWWTWVWASSRSWWWTGKPGMLQSMGSQRVEHD